jgi:CII-binding regulator of phage lambda lysogenization HflD
VAGMNKEALKLAFEELLTILGPLEHHKLESRAFMYLDIISWLESRIQNKDVQTIIKEKSASKKQAT